MAINKVVYGNDTLIDLTEDTATADDVLNGKTFHLKNGLRATGNVSIGDGSLIIKENATTVETFNANQTTDTTLTLGNLAFYNGDTLASGVDPVSIGIDMDLLWTNASPTANFYAQTVSVDLSSYTMALVVFRQRTTNQVYGTTAITNVGNSGCAFSYLGGYIGFRHFTVSTSGIAFELGAKQSSFGTNDADSTYCVPYKIYGIK